MFIHKPKIKEKPKRGRQILEGSYLILMRDKNDKELKQSLRALIRAVRMETFLSGIPAGEIILNNKKQLLVGRYGNLGLPISVEYDVYLLGTPVPEILKELWSCVYSSNGVNLQDNELIKWGVALMLAQGNHPTHGCYRCKDETWLFGESLTPCQACRNEIKKIIAKLTDTEFESIVPTTQTIVPPGIESADGVGREE